jgi:peptidyl-tRNA hydrolase, PTH1 family
VFVIVGLGNPGREYQGTRHNLGYQVIEALSRALPAGPTSRECRCICAFAQLPSGKIVLAQPLTYMNRSGRAVAELIRRYPVEPERLLLVYDDLDLSPGMIRLRQGGGSAGHRGVQSVIDTLGIPDFFRLRLGIGKPPAGQEAADYVLEIAPPAERELLEQAVERAGQAALALIREGPSTAMNRSLQA